jgi:hypothetical protein
VILARTVGVSLLMSCWKHTVYVLPSGAATDVHPFLRDDPYSDVGEGESSVDISDPNAGIQLPSSRAGGKKQGFCKTSSSGT